MSECIISWEDVTDEQVRRAYTEKIDQCPSVQTGLLVCSCHGSILGVCEGIDTSGQVEFQTWISQ